MMLATCGRMSTLFSAVTVPVASSMTSMSRFCTTTVVTLTGGPARRGRMRRRPGRAAPSFAAGRALVRDSSQPPPAATRTSTARPAMSGFFMGPRL